MWIQVRSMDGRRSVRVDNLSKLTHIEELRERLVEHFEAEPERQRLFYRGKQLEDGHSLFDYDVGLNDIIQLMVRPVPMTNSDAATCPSTTPTQNGTTEEEAEGDKMDTNGATNGENGDASAVNGQLNGSVQDSGEESTADDTIGLYKVGDKVDARDLSMGAWFEAQVVKVTEEDAPTSGDDAPSSSTSSERNVFYHVKFDEYSDEEVSKLTAADVRPRARYRMQWDLLSVGQKLMVNYNPDAPTERGFWYDAVISGKENEGKKVFGKLVLGESMDASEAVMIKFVDEIFRIETRDSSDQNGQCSGEEGEGEARMKKPDCSWCKDNPRRKCKHCACSVCGGKDGPDKQILCDECDMAYHLWCLSPPLEDVPECDEWYCPECKNDSSEVIAAGEKLRYSKKKSGMMSKKNECNRDWGKGMACVGRTKMCTIVPSNHFGPIPGVPVGSMWKFRVQVSEAGVHRPHVAGIHGRESEGSYSIVLSGGYEDDVDKGFEFTYSGSGGRDLSGNKRTAKQSMDQKLTAMNRALARNCDAPIDDKKGAMAKDWKNGKPVRVVRNHKGRKNSKYAPEEGNRYDGIYKIVKYWPEKNTSGFIVWKYLLRRDDPSPAPWSSEGKKAIKKLDLTMQYPEGYLESQAAAQEQNSSEEENGKANRKAKRGKKRKNSDFEDSPKPKQPRYELTKEQKSLIKTDTTNKKLWDDVMSSTCTEGTAGLLSRIQDAFACVVCQEVVFQPISTPCGHNMCKSCLMRSFRAEVYTCPNCRHQLGKDYSMATNKPLQKILKSLFPGYDGGR